jgi:hypothetical protein
MIYNFLEAQSGSWGPMPKYKNAPIEEALCEFRFAPEQGNPEWDLTLPGRLQVQEALREYSAPFAPATPPNLGRW